MRISTHKKSGISMSIFLTLGDDFMEPRSYVKTSSFMDSCSLCLCKLDILVSVSRQCFFKGLDLITDFEVFLL